MVVRPAARVARLVVGSWLLTGMLPAQAEIACPSIDGPKCRVALSTGIAMAYLEVGPAHGPAVILVHGLTDSSRSWSTTMEALHRLDPGLRILAIDQRGHGASSMPPAEPCAAAPERCFRMADFAADLEAFMAAKGIAKATMAGHSLGTFDHGRALARHLRRAGGSAHPSRAGRAGGAGGDGGARGRQCGLARLCAQGAGRGQLE